MGGIATEKGEREMEKKQLTRADLAKMAPEEIVKAQKDGLLKDVLSGKKKHPATAA
ncbi:hypothetical protein ACIO14_14900 [Nocardia fluminea]|uniref:hypothetical protein n=1 Tax=Nocardia fluminea TaxID=134984 RepID=UPI003805E771